MKPFMHFHLTNLSFWVWLLNINKQGQKSIKTLHSEEIIGHEDNSSKGRRSDFRLMLIFMTSNSRAFSKIYFVN
jgi:hypothetical protein